MTAPVRPSAPAGGPEAIIREAHDLARAFYRKHGCVVREGYRFDGAHPPQERMMWRLAVAALRSQFGACAISISLRPRPGADR